MGKKSGPLAFLNKKGWHPGNQRNQEKVWKKEQEALAEKKQVEELRKQYDEARQKEEVEAMAVAAGVKKKQERLDWMYQGGMVAKQEAEKRADAQMLGEKEVDLPAVEEPAKAQQMAELPTFYTQDTPASANEMWQKLHGDPMFAIKQQELMARKNIVANPVQMDVIRKRLKDKASAKAARKAARAEAKAAKKAAKRAKKEKKRRKAESSSSSGSESGDTPEDRSPKRAKLSNGQAAAAHPRNRARSPDHDHGRESHREDRHRASDTRPLQDRHNRDWDTGRRGRDRRDDSRERDRGQHRSRQRDHYQPDRSRHRDRDSERVESRYRDRSKEQDGRRSHREHERHEMIPADSPRRSVENGQAAVKVYRDAASAQRQDLSYGLNAATNAVIEDRDAKRMETQKRLEEARRRREAEDKEKAEQRYKRKEHKTGQLSEEERAKRLAEMSGNAEAHEEARWARLQAARRRDDSQAEEEALALKQKADASAQPGTHHQDTAKFLQQATNQAFSGEHASLADRIGRRKYYNDRSRDESQGAFQR